MKDLTNRERHLVGLGAALGSNCVPCVEHLIPQARMAGLTDEEIDAAIRHADRVRQVPARKVLEAALNLLARRDAQAARPDEPRMPCPDRMMGSMRPTMASMMASCHPSTGTADDCAGPKRVEEAAAANGPRSCC